MFNFCYFCVKVNATKVSASQVWLEADLDATSKKTNTKKYFQKLLANIIDS